MHVRSLLASLAMAGATCATVVGMGISGAASRVVSAEASPPPQDKVGTIKGRLVWGGATVPPKVQIKTDGSAACSKNPLYDPELVVDEKTKGVANAFAFLPTPKGSNAEAEKALVADHPKVVIDQIGCEFAPLSVAVFKDQTLVFKSSDPVGHNVHYTSFGGSNDNFMLKPNGEAERKLKATPKPRPMNLVCDIHPWMKASIMVFNHPFYAVTGPDGSFEIAGVPAGTQTLIVQHPKGGYVTEGGSRGMTVEVKAGEVTDIGSLKLDPSKFAKK